MSFRLQLLGAIWLSATTGLVAWSIVGGAEFSAIVWLLLLCLTPMAIMLMIGFGEAGPTVAEVLYATNSRKDNAK